MKTHRRIISALLALSMLVSVVTPALAFTVPDQPGIQIDSVQPALHTEVMAKVGDGNPGPLTPDSSRIQQESSYSLDEKPVQGFVPGKHQPSADNLVSVIVDLDLEALATYQGGIDGLAPTSPDGVATLDANSPDSQAYLAYANAQIDRFETMTRQVAPGAQFVHRYTVVLGGVSMVLPESEVSALMALPGVKNVYADRLEQPQTDASPEFIGAPTVWDALGGQESAGEGVIVGVLDSGIWPEHPSFSDPDPSAKPYDPPTGGPFACEFGGSGEIGDDPFPCNNKLIGAHFNSYTYLLLNDPLPGEFPLSARDADGHGTHTASTSAGNGKVAASIFGVPRGEVSGIAPRAHVIAYRVCMDLGCYGSDSAAAVQQAILDGVDVINFSISGGGNPFSDPVSLAFLDAYASGVLVSASAGNSGPGLDTTDHREPWTITVGASTSDREFQSTVTLTGTHSVSATLDSIQIPGVSVTDGISQPTPVVLAPSGKELCPNSLAAGTFNGEIVVCLRGVNARVEKGYNVMQAGGSGMLLYNPPTTTDVETDNHFIPAVHMNYAGAGDLLLDFLATHAGVVATFTPGVASLADGDVMASFSSRGGPGQTLGVSKPDVTAPGVQILAGHTPASVSLTTGPNGELFQAIAGTSMSSPHVAGAAALLKALHPNWTPGQIKSALMTSARVNGVSKPDGSTQADAFDFGSGRIDLNWAGDPGLTFDEGAVNYFDLANRLWDANYPSLYVPNLAGEVTVFRTVQSQVNAFTRWSLAVDAPADLVVTVPSGLAMEPFGGSGFPITVNATAVPMGAVRMARLTLTSQSGHVVTFPITIVRGEGEVAVEKVCDTDTVVIGETTTCTISVTNRSFSHASFSLEDRLPTKLGLVQSSVSGATVDGNGITAFGGLSPASAPTVDVAVDPTASPAGYLGLGGFAGSLVVPLGDESIANYNVPPFQFGGVTYSRIGIVSNGYVVLGGGTTADIEYINLSPLPNTSPPNNVMAPFWTDLNPGAGGRVLLNELCDGPACWLVIEWEAVPNYSDDEPNTFQVWISDTQPDDISFTYGPVITTGDGGFLTVGAENDSGTSGGMVYFDGAGTAPAPSYPNGNFEVDVLSLPGTPGETRVITYDATGVALGAWTNTARMYSELVAGASESAFAGVVRGERVAAAISVSAVPTTTYVGRVVTVTVNITDDLGAPMPGQLVNFSDGVMTATATTGDSGSAAVAWTSMVPATRTVTAISGALSGNTTATWMEIIVTSVSLSVMPTTTLQFGQPFTLEAAVQASEAGRASVPIANYPVFFTEGLFTAALSGANEAPIPVTTTTGSGLATFVVNPATGAVNYLLNFTGITSPTMAHVHVGAAGTNGPAIFTLYDATGASAPSTIPASGVFTPTLEQYALMLQGNLYVNVHSVAYPAGEIRGQIEGAVSALTNDQGVATIEWIPATVGAHTVYAIAGQQGAFATVLVTAPVSNVHLPVIQKNGGAAE